MLKRMVLQKQMKVGLEEAQFSTDSIEIFKANGAKCTQSKRKHCRSKMNTWP
jgi:hypothetical protein